MYQLLVSGNGWNDTSDTMCAGRVFEYTDPSLESRLKPNGELQLDLLRSIPALFMSETQGRGTQTARVGMLHSVRRTGTNYALEYVYDPTIPPITNATLTRLSRELGIEGFQFERTHWSVKDVDLFRVLLRNRPAGRPTPKVFSLLEPEAVEHDLVSAMMPFQSSFAPVYAVLQQVAARIRMRCIRADDIWNHDAIIQDVVSLIDRSKIVICDCTGKNANVFYEAGIAHSLGRDVVLITQSESDIPFDLRHLRYIPYLNNGEGLDALANKLESRLQTLCASQT